MRGSPTRLRIDHERPARHRDPLVPRRPDRGGIGGVGARKAMTFHDLRATGLTWLAVRGDDPLKIKQRAGHAAFTTTEGYIREAEAVADGFRAAFPALPASLLEAPRSTELGRLRSTFGPRKRDLERVKRGVSRSCIAGWKGLEGDAVRGIEPMPPDPHRAGPFVGPIERRRGGACEGAGGSRGSRHAVVRPARRIESSSDRDPSRTRAEDDLAVAVRLAAQAGEWAIVATPSRQLDALRREREGGGF
jgi:hypothetical protein